MDDAGLTSSLRSVDAYRSIRVKETERPHVKQVIVRNEDVSLRAAAAGPRGAGQEAGTKQRLKVRGRMGLVLAGQTLGSHLSSGS